MKKLLILIPFLFACRETNIFEAADVVTLEDPPTPLCEPTIEGRMTLVEENEQGPPTITHGYLVDTDCDPSTPAVFVPEEDFPGKGKPFQDN